MPGTTLTIKVGEKVIEVSGLHDAEKALQDLRYAVGMGLVVDGELKSASGPLIDETGRADLQKLIRVVGKGLIDNL